MNDRLTIHTLPPPVQRRDITFCGGHYELQTILTDSSLSCSETTPALLTLMAKPTADGISVAKRTRPASSCRLLCFDRAAGIAGESHRSVEAWWLGGHGSWDEELKISATPP